MKNNINMSGRRNFGSVNRSAISRGSFIRGAGAVVGGVAATGLGFAKGVSAQATNPLPIISNPDPQNIISDGAGGWIVYPSGKNWLATGTNMINRARTIYDPNLSPDTLSEIKGLLDAGVDLCVINTKWTGDDTNWSISKIIGVNIAKNEITFEDDILKSGDPYNIGFRMYRGIHPDALEPYYLSYNFDSRNVQWALNSVNSSLASNGMPTVFLKATKKNTHTFTPFLFPEAETFRYMSGNIGITKSVILTGEILPGQLFSNYQEDLNGTPIMTTIEKGATVFTSQGYSKEGPFPTNVEIKNLISNSAIGEFIAISYVGDYTDENGNYVPPVLPVKSNIHDIKIVNLTNPVWQFISGIAIVHFGKTNVSNCMIRIPGSPDSFPQGIGLGSDREGILEGTVVNNDIKIGNGLYGSYGIGIHDSNSSPGGTIIIQNNKVESDIPVHLEHYLGNVQIVNNNLTGRVFGIMALSHLPPDNPNAAFAKRIIKGNLINMDTVNPDGSRKNPMIAPFLPISWWPEAPIVTINPYTAGIVGMGSSFLADIAFGDVASLSNADISNNKIIGKANYAVYMGPDTFWGAQNIGSNNNFWGNNISGLDLILWIDFLGETVQPYSYYFDTTTSNNTVAGQTGGIAYVEAGNSSNIISGPGLPKSCGIGTIKNPPVNKIYISPKQQAAIDKVKSNLFFKF